MAANLVTLCVFHDYTQARQAANLLNAAGIPAFFSGVESSIAASGLAPAVVTIRLDVPEFFLDQACAVLNTSDESVKAYEEALRAAVDEGQEDEFEQDEEESRGPIKRFLGAFAEDLVEPFAPLPSSTPSDDSLPQRIRRALYVLFFFLVLPLLWFMLSMLLED